MSLTQTIVAEMSSNHLGSFERAMDIVVAAKEAGADCIKVQTFTPDEMVLDRTFTLQSGPWKGRRLYDLYVEAHTPREWHIPIFNYARKIGLEPFGSAFSKADVDFLESLDVARHKISSFELTDLALIGYAASKKKPLILSTGMATKAEIATAVNTTRWHGCEDITLLKCVSGYPSNPEEANLGAMLAMRDAFECDVGLSDHSRTLTVPITAAALGADMIECHLSLDRQGLDGAFSLLPDEFSRMAAACRTARRIALASTYGRKPSEDSQLDLRRGLYAATDLPHGHVLTADDVVTARPCKGLAANSNYIGMTLAKSLLKHEAIREEHLSY